MLHITNGDSIAGSLMQSGVPGDKMPFREDLTSGPTPAGLTTHEWLRLRADFLTEAYQPATRDCLQDLTEQQAALECQAQHQETVLWFAHDLNCQIHLINLLTLLARIRSDRHQLSLICIGEFPGIHPFICLGQLDSEKLESLFDGRHRVTEGELELASRAWSAYCSPDPSDVEALINGDTSALPFLAAALRLHLTRFPSEKNGLGLVENWVLQQLTVGPARFPALFAQFRIQHPLYGLGDAQFWAVLRRMSDCAEPLTRITGVPPDSTPGSLEWGQASIDITPAGQQVLGGKRDFIELNGIDLWLGGVHLQTGTNLWRLDEQTGKLRHAAA